MDNVDNAGSPRRTRKRLIGLTAAAVAVLVVLAVVTFSKLSGPAPVATRAVGAAASPSISPTPSTPWEQLVADLQAQGQALVAGDQKGWMAAVDPAQPVLQSRYKGIFGALHTLGVTSFSYEPGISTHSLAHPTTFTFATGVLYCYGTDTCRDDQGKPTLQQKLAMKPVGGHYVITKVTDSVTADSSLKDSSSPAPWGDGKLKFATGKRVILAADPAQAKLLPKVLPAAEKAAAVADGFAKVLGTTPSRYRVYLAGPKQWTSWYGGRDSSTSSAAVPVGKYGADILINLDENPDARDLQWSLQAEMGDLIIISGAKKPAGEDVTWLQTGASDYIGFSPASVTTGFDMPQARTAARNHPPTSMIPKKPVSKASAETWWAFDGLSDLAVGCLTAKYGRPKAFAFVKQSLITGASYDDAATAALGVPFKTVDKVCASWIRGQV